MKTILVVDDTPLNLKLINKILEGHHEMVGVESAKDAFTYLESNRPDLILLDILMPEVNGFEVMEYLKKDEDLKNIPVIFLTADYSEENEIKCLKMGAIDFIAKPLKPEIVLSRIEKAIELDSLRISLEKEVERKNEELKDASETVAQANKDALTNLWNRRYTESFVNNYLREEDASGAVFMMDIDEFKVVNDRYGHIFGDEVLMKIADTIRAVLGKNNIPCRIGGDEFYMFLPGYDDKQTIAELARILINRLNENVKFPDGKSVGVSLGIALAKANGKDFGSLYACADKALYYIKNTEKNNFAFIDDVMDKLKNAGDGDDLDSIRKRIYESDVEGNYVLEYERFKNIARFLERNVRRNGKNVVYTLFTLKGADNSGKDYMGELAEVMKKCLRIGDVSTRYSENQILVILMDATVHDAEMVANRVCGGFCMRVEDESIELKYDVQRI